MKEDRDKLKEYFETGDRPSEAQFIKFIDSMIIQKDDDVWVTGADKKVGIGKEFPDEKLHVDGHIKLEGDLTGSKSWRTFTISSAPNLHGPYMHFHPKDVPNQGGLMGFIAGDGDSGGFKFLQYEKDANNVNRWHPRLKIEKDGNVGIGLEAPVEKLHVDGSIRLHGDISGQHSWRTLTIGAAPNLAGPYMHFHPKDVANSGGEMAFVAGEGDSGGFKFLQYEKDANNINHWHPRLKIQKDGNVGIGTESPANKLEIDNSSGADTGLCLPNGASPGSVLICDDVTGNASWQLRSTLDDGDWAIHSNGNDIYSGKPGNVGIGTSSPDHKFHVKNGNSVLEAGGSQLDVGGTQGDYGVFQRRYENQGGRMLFQQETSNPNGPNRRGLFLETYITSNGLWSVMGAKEGTVYMSTGDNSDYSWVPGTLNGGDRAGWINQDKEWFIRGKVSMGDVSNSAATQPEQLYVKGKTRLDGDTNIDGNFTVDQEVPIRVVRMVISGNDIHYAPGSNNYGKSTGHSSNNYAAAVIVGFATSRTDLEGITGAAAQFDIGVSTYLRGTTWYVSCDLASLGGPLSHERWAVDVMFIRKEMSQIAGSSWGRPLADQI